MRVPPRGSVVQARRCEGEYKGNEPFPDSISPAGSLPGTPPPAGDNAPSGNGMETDGEQSQPPAAGDSSQPPAAGDSQQPPAAGDIPSVETEVLVPDSGSDDEEEHVVTITGFLGESGVTTFASNAPELKAIETEAQKLLKKAKFGPIMQKDLYRIASEVRQPMAFEEDGWDKPEHRYTWEQVKAMERNEFDHRLDLHSIYGFLDFDAEDRATR